MPEPTMKLLADCVRDDALSGEVVTPRMLAQRWGGCPRAIEDQLDRMVAAGQLNKRIKAPKKPGRKALPYVIYWKARDAS